MTDSNRFQPNPSEDDPSPLGQQPEQDQFHNQQHHGPMPPVPQSGNGIAITALVLGIVAIAFSFVPFIGWLAFVLGPAALVFGIIGLAKRFPKRGFSITGIILGGLSMVITILVTAFLTASAVGISERIKDQVNEEHTVQYKVTTTAPANITYTSGDGFATEEVAADWTQEIVTTGFDYVSLTVAAQSASVTCEILVDGFSVSSNSSNGDSAKASCSSSVIE